MTEFKQYLLRLIFCALLVSLARSLVRGRRAERAAALCGGCLLILTAVKPLLRVELSALPDPFSGLSRSERLEDARRKNEALLRGLIETQAAEKIAAQAQALGFSVRAEVTARAAAGGSFVPDAVLLRGGGSEAQRRALSDYIERELAIPAARQRWGSP